MKKSKWGRNKYKMYSLKQKWPQPKPVLIKARPDLHCGKGPTQLRPYPVKLSPCKKKRPKEFSPIKEQQIKATTNVIQEL